MQKIENQLIFTCPSCQNGFEFDQTYNQIGEYQLVVCPNCSENLVTVRKNNQIALEYLDC